LMILMTSNTSIATEPARKTARTTTWPEGKGWTAL
jgi:hypothetical protein